MGRPAVAAFAEQAGLVVMAALLALAIGGCSGKHAAVRPAGATSAPTTANGPLLSGVASLPPCVPATATTGPIPYGCFNADGSVEPGSLAGATPDLPATAGVLTGELLVVHRAAPAVSTPVDGQVELQRQGAALLYPAVLDHRSAGGDRFAFRVLKGTYTLSGTSPQAGGTRCAGAGPVTVKDGQLIVTNVVCFVP
jgi:hypothetical protein